MSQASENGGRIERPEFLAVLGLIPPVTVEDVKQAYLEKAKLAHPDRGGTPEGFARLQEAFQQATEYAQFKASRMQWLSQWVGQYADQEQLIGEIRELGGRVEVEGCDWLQMSIGSDFGTVLDRLLGVYLEGPKIDDGVMLHLGAARRTLVGLRRLALVNTQVTPVGLRELRHFESLRYLDLSGTKVSHWDVQAIVNDHDRLETIVLRNCGISWSSRVRLRMSRRGLTVTI